MNAEHCKSNFVKELETRDFEKDIFGNEVVWTYLVAELAAKNSNVFYDISGFKKKDFYNIFLEVQPITPYPKVEGNTNLDLACGAIQLRKNTKSGIEFNSTTGSEVCFLEAKYFSDVSTKTENYPIRNQIDRVIENLLCFQSQLKYPDKLTFTFLTPRIFKDNPKSRFYGFKLLDYVCMNSNQFKLNTKNIQEQMKLDAEERYQKDWKYPSNILDRLSLLEIRWVTYEELLGVVEPRFINNDITKKNQAFEIWTECSEKILDIV